MKRVLRSFFLIINYKTLIVTALSLLATYICVENKWYADFPVMLVSVAIVFPVVFSIDSAYKRRENALKHLSDFKSHAIAIYFAARDWQTAEAHDLKDKIKVLLREMFITTREMLRGDNPREEVQLEAKVYRQFTTLSGYALGLKKHGLEPGEFSRISQYISKMMIGFDNMLMIHHYRTPITLRAYSKVFINIFPIIYGPYFANMVNLYSSHLEYVMPILYSFILVSLDNIQDHLEQPFDEIGEDDIRINPDEITALME